MVVFPDLKTFQTPSHTKFSCSAGAYEVMKPYFRNTLLTSFSSIALVTQVLLYVLSSERWDKYYN